MQRNKTTPMRILLISSLIIFGLGVLNAQNLVPNPSFEEYITCPVNVVGLNYQGPPFEPWIADWYSMSGTPDYFHECSGSESFNYPLDNAWGSQAPFDGQAYLALLTLEPFLNGREYAAVALSSPLSVGVQYYASFYTANNEDGEAGISDCSTNNIGLNLFTAPPYYWNSFDDNNSLTPMNNSVLNRIELLTDSIDWTKVEGTFIANQAYTHLAIGNFYDDASTLIAPFVENGCEAFYYVDYICIASAEEDCNNPLSIQNIQSSEQFSIYPNPALELLHVKSQNGRIINSLMILNSLGLVVLRDSTIIHDKLDVSDLPAGVYYLRLGIDKEPFFFNYSFIKF